MNKDEPFKKYSLIKVEGDQLFDRIVSILEQARASVVRSVNTNMVLAYWLIGREIVEEVQAGKERAEYGKQVLEDLSAKLNKRYGSGFSVPNLQNFRKFYLTYPTRLQIQYPAGTKLTESEKQYPVGSEFDHGFHPNLSWSHYRALMRVKNEQARNFYEHEAAECRWGKAQLERQIHTATYERIMAHHGQEGLSAPQRQRLPGEAVPAETIIKSPYVLEFLGLPDSPQLHENAMEQAIIDNLQSFLLELGKGFSFVARQKRLCFGEQDYYVDLVFYNFILKCFVLIDLKIGKLTHSDVGQMDGYVRLFEDQYKTQGDNPTLGLILCSDHTEAVAKYSVLSEGKQVFASKYLSILPSEEELTLEIQKERKLIEAALAEKHDALPDTGTDDEGGD